MFIFYVLMNRELFCNDNRKKGRKQGSKEGVKEKKKLIGRKDPGMSIQVQQFELFL